MFHFGQLVLHFGSFWAICLICCVILGIFKLLLVIFQASGVFLLSVGVWMELQLHKYMEVSNFFATTVPLVFVSLGGSILCLSLLACCCTAKGKVPLLYIVSLSLNVVGWHCYCYKVMSCLENLRQAFKSKHKSLKVNSWSPLTFNWLERALQN